ncbi:glycosyltransferase family 4 protein [Pedobacter faecalis]|uniref:glycosyltransferase family 4 protein n=1 Tax=Pedobacter faecalis TaxID=3041495 RepID=UPI00254C2013|nr:glycosyltransferase family 4 protein [Pedobacter sp. ELA7]
MKTKKHKILVLGQTPPPYGGQALMLQALLDGKYRNAELVHVRLEFSKDFNDMGSFRLYKFWGLFKAILLTAIYRFTQGADILYYGPAGPNKLGMWRDVILLAPIRFLFKKTIIHTHAGGTSRLYQKLHPVGKFLYRVAFFNPDILITLTEYSHGDETVLRAKKLFVVPNGIEDKFLYNRQSNDSPTRVDQPYNLLYIGAMYAERGMVELIEAARILKDKRYKFCLRLVGIFIDSSFSKYISELVIKHNLSDYVEFLGTKTGRDKWEILRNTDVFVFPTYVPSETFGVVLVEAMQFKVPIVASRWNGIPFVVGENEDALLVNPKDSEDLASKIQLLLDNEELRLTMGMNGRSHYLSKYSIQSFIKNMDDVFSEL